MPSTKLWAAADESIFDKLSDIMAVLGSFAPSCIFYVLQIFH